MVDFIAKKPLLESYKDVKHPQAFNVLTKRPEQRVRVGSTNKYYENSTNSTGIVEADSTGANLLDPRFYVDGNNCTANATRANNSTVNATK